MRKLTNPVQLFDLLLDAWGSDTSSKWLPENPARGQCSVTSLIVQDLFGGDILKTKTNGGTHFYNRIGETRWDLTISQFNRPIPFDDVQASRKEAFADTSIEQYSILKSKLGISP